ncbi:MAG: hypothetical protein ACYDHX_06545 [Methanothrix sp.]
MPVTLACRAVRGCCAVVRAGSLPYKRTCSGAGGRSGLGSSGTGVLEGKISSPRLLKPNWMQIE